MGICSRSRRDVNLSPSQSSFRGKRRRLMWSIRSLRRRSICDVLVAYHLQSRRVKVGSSVMQDSVKQMVLIFLDAILVVLASFMNCLKSGQACL